MKMYSYFLLAILMISLSDAKPRKRLSSSSQEDDEDPPKFDNQKQWPKNPCIPPPWMQNGPPNGGPNFGPPPGIGFGPPPGMGFGPFGHPPPGCKPPKGFRSPNYRRRPSPGR